MTKSQIAEKDRIALSADRPKIGLAFSGGTLRAISQVGMLEVFDEHNIPVDYIAAASSGCVTAASYACGTMDILKDVWFNLTGEKLRALMSREGSNGGIYHLRKMEDLFRQITQNKRFEDVHPRLGFVAVDIVAGEEIVLQMGDIARAIRTSCSIQGLFEPVRWGNKLLVDGGLLLDTVPVLAVQNMGADIVIGVDIADSKYVFGNYGPLIYFWKQYMLLRRILPIKAVKRVAGLVLALFESELPVLTAEEEAKKSWFSVLSRSL